ncbi:MAG: tRNA (guanosine(37)-N1)-methyltransferase TrmD [Crocinitomicaceae bacterium]|jgi:tRNA (guanine37-N1)-methyltransferase|nr:tRNA (guanosine(37)-N1)-methyltransferase TrmD [Crocinitomicaceae bacterium]MDP4723639.1 tRNA (guanosine(37)-N1)-methyltransferase TrmD [Crocinitomicaceae bacterium]MDP4738909.1 tRNA (guanosine(37)-N1)-methyltransferase TrmD [Crocinitomicaceae bacterium]MDP4798983.1 tRNA (guanosine(37)-N1)-methyltransferase TrmD [Crocinitomicaceae bacterium]MDP4805754.1 tRNA (guanosine(37)-N1)-methyltransferase TrmD [Crocinitomicaceae bacterium]
MRIDILTVLPELLTSPFAASIMQRAQTKGHVEIHVHNLRDYADNKHRNVDDYQYGGGAGMVMSIVPIAKAIESLQAERQYDDIIYMTPDGEVLEQSTCNQLSLAQNLLILCGHYKGVDQRVRDLYVTKEISVGSYVLSGGELAAAIVVDAVVRLIPGVLNDETSALTDSFQDGLLAPPVYTRPPVFNGLEVPEVLLGGNPKDVDAWREAQAYARTKERRPDLLEE